MKVVRLAMLAGTAMAACLIDGCKTVNVDATLSRFGSADATLVLAPAGAPRIDLRQNQGFAFPDRIDPVSMPEYPPDLLPMQLDPVELCVDLDIDQTGAVTASSLRADVSCSAPDSRYLARFAAAAFDATRQWRFRPAYLCAIPNGETAADVCAEPDAVRTPAQVRLPYLFRFTRHDGVPGVSARHAEY